MQEYVNALSNLLPSGLVQLSETAAHAVTRLALEAVSKQVSSLAPIVGDFLAFMVTAPGNRTADGVCTAE